MCALSFYPTPIPDGAVDLNFPAPQYGADFASIVGNAGTPSDGWDALIAGMVLALSGVDNLFLGLAFDEGVINRQNADVQNIWEQDATDSTATLLNTGQPLSDQFDVDSQGSPFGPPPPPPNTGSGAGGGGATNPPGCGTHGMSQILLSDNTQNCFAATAMPQMSMADGNCSFEYLADGSAFYGKTAISAIKLQSGDPNLWSAAVDQVKSTATGTVVSRVTINMRPYKTGHFEARFLVTTSRNPNGEVWCMIVGISP